MKKKVNEVIKTKPENVILDLEPGFFVDKKREPIASLKVEKGKEKSKFVPIGIYKLYPSAEMPAYQTQKSACFDLQAYLGEEIETVEVFNRMMMNFNKPVVPMAERDGEKGFYIEPGESIFIPTGLAFDIPEDYKINIYPRSGTAGKKHLRCTNCVGIIDEDYVHETKIILYNDSESRQLVCHGDRLVQAEIVPVYRASFFTIKEKMGQKTDRAGGLGHTDTRGK